MHDKRLKIFKKEIPSILDNFEAVCKVVPADRWNWANDSLNSVYRDGWFVNTPVAERGDAETVSEHVEHLKGLIKNYFPLTVQEECIAYADVHDAQESIANALIDGVKRDLNPRFNKASYSISDDDKDYVERLAIELLLEGYQDKLEIWNSYKAGKTQAAKDFTGLDKICVMWRCLDFVESGKYQAEDFQAYWDYWTAETALQKLPKFVSELYNDTLIPRINVLKFHLKT